MAKSTKRKKKKAKKPKESTLNPYYTYELERWTFLGEGKHLSAGWLMKYEVSVTNKGNYSRITFVTPEGKKLRKGATWNRTNIDHTKLVDRGFVKTRRNKPKEMKI